jgi:hypothetical protein
MAGPPFKVKAVYAYSSEHDDDLNFREGEIINVTEEEGEDWYVGEYTDSAGTCHEGLFPKNFVEKYEPEVPTRPTRPARPKSEARSPQPAAHEPQHEEVEEEAPPVPAASKPTAPLVEVPPAASHHDEEPRSPPTATAPKPAVSKAEPPPAPKPAPAEPAQSEPTPVKAKPPPVAPKSSAFKDRIAAFNKAEAAPIAPIQPGRGAPRNEYIKRPFIADPPSRNAYIPPVHKSEPVHKPYIREEDPEIKRKQEEDRQAAEVAGLTADAPAAAAITEEGEEAPKPMSLKERMALLQKEQEAQRARHAEAAPKKERKPPPPKKPSESSDRGVAQEGEGEELERVPTERERQSLDVQRAPRVQSAQRKPTDPMSPIPAVPQHEILSGGEEADQSAAGETTEDDSGTIGPDDEDKVHPVSHGREPDVGDEEDTTEDAGDEEEEELDEEEQRKQRLRERMARLAGGQQGGGPFNPFGMPPAAAAPPKKRSTREKKASEDSASVASAPQIPQMIAIPGMGGIAPMPRVQSPKNETAHEHQAEGETEAPAEEEEEQPLPPRRSTNLDREAPPPVPKGKLGKKGHRKSSRKLFDGSSSDLDFEARSNPKAIGRGDAMRMNLAYRELRALSAGILTTYNISILPHDWRLTLSSQNNDQCRLRLQNEVYHLFPMKAPDLCQGRHRVNLDLSRHRLRPLLHCPQVRVPRAMMRCRYGLSAPPQRPLDLTPHCPFGQPRLSFLHRERCRHGHHSHRKISEHLTLAVSPARQRLIEEEAGFRLQSLELVHLLRSDHLHHRHPPLLLPAGRILIFSHPKIPSGEKATMRVITTPTSPRAPSIKTP